MVETIDDLVKEVEELVKSVLIDAPKCDSGNRQAGIRVRKDMMILIDKAKGIRTRVLELRS